MLKTLFVFVRNAPLLIFLLFISVVICAGSVLGYDYLYSEGMFSTWKILYSPPAKISKILAADFLAVWVESIDGSVYSLNIQCSHQVSECNIMKWERVNPNAMNLPVDIPGDGTMTDHQGTCKFGDLRFFREPDGNVVECVRISNMNPAGVEVICYARTDNDKIQYLSIIPMGNTSFFGLVIFAMFTGLVLGVLLYTKLLKQ
jgi:hypothetical protein